MEDTGSFADFTSGCRAMFSCECCLRRFHLSMMACGLAVLGGDPEVSPRVCKKDMLTLLNSCPSMGHIQILAGKGVVKACVSDIFLALSASFTHPSSIPWFRDAEVKGIPWLVSSSARQSNEECHRETSDSLMMTPVPARCTEVTLHETLACLRWNSAICDF